MKHRSIGVFILLAAALIVAPQASEELLALKDSFSSRMRVEVLHAFLNMHGSVDVGDGADRSSVLLLASSEDAGEEVDETGGDDQKAGDVSDMNRRRTESKAEGDRLAMIIEPELDLRPLLPEVEKIEAEALLPRVTKWEKRSMQELAMMIPHDSIIPNLASALKLPFVNADGKDGKASVVVSKKNVSYTLDELEREIEKANEADEGREHFKFALKLKGEKAEAEEAACDAKEKALKARRNLQTKSAAPAVAPPSEVERRKSGPKAESNSFALQFVTIGE